MKPFRSIYLDKLEERDGRTPREYKWKGTFSKMFLGSTFEDLPSRVKAEIEETRKVFKQAKEKRKQDGFNRQIKRTR